MEGDLFNQLPPDQAQRRLIETELDTTMLVEAAAGTGKTTSLLKRMVALLAEGRCRVGTMAAVTFTRKATAELRARFQVALEEALRRAGGARRARLQEALEHVEQCVIGTIHSFCGRLLRERPIEAGVDIAFEELDEDADFRLRREAWDEYVAGLHARSDPMLGRIEELALDLAVLKETYLGYADYPDVEEWPAAPCELDEALLAAAREALRGFGRTAEGLGEIPRHAGADELIAFLRDLPLRLRNTVLGRDRELMPLLEDCLGVKEHTYKEWRDGPVQGKREWERWRRFLAECAAPLVEQWHRKRYQPILEVLQGGVAVYDRLRAERGVLSYQDLLMKAAALLRGKPHVRRHFRERFSHLLVDEFQDTDPVQAEVMLLLTAADPAEDDWRACRPVPGSLFVVGDPKQSIYRFRRADIVTYNEVGRIIGGCGRIVRLGANFRSTGPLIEWFNTVSADLFKTPGDCSPPDSPMLAARPGPAGGDCSGVRVLPIPAQRKAGTIAFEADFIARTIRDALDRRLTVPRGADETDKPPHVTAGDFMVLTWTRNSLVVYAAALQALRIPVEVTGGTAVNELDEVALLHTVLAAVVEADNPVALVGLLRSELFGISDAQLYRFAQAHGAFNYFLAAPSIAGLEPIAEAFERLRTYAGWLSCMQPVAAAERIAADLGLFARAATPLAGAERAGALCKGIELLRSAGRDHWTPAALVEYLWQLVDAEAGFRERHDGMPLLPCDGRAVRVMNLHQAKGLEAPIVFLAEASGEAPRNADRHIDRRSGRVRGFLQVRGRRRGPYEGPVLAVPEGWPQHEAEERRFLEAERDRLLYVAASRAAAQLVIGQAERKPRWRKLLAHAPAGAALAEPPPASAPPPETETLPGDAPLAFAASLQARLEEAARPTWEVRRLKEMVVRGGRPARPGEHGTEWGSVIHVLLEAAMSRPGSDLAALAAAALEENDLDPGRAEEAVGMVRAVMGSDLWRRAAAAPERLTEVPIQYLEPAAGGAGEGEVPTIVRGVIDLVFREPGGWLIVDYKTDDRDEAGLAELVEHYAPQVRAYAAAWGRLTGEAVAEAGLFFVNTRRYREIGLPQAAGAGAGNSS